MIPNQWYVILESCEIRKNQVKGFTRFGEKLLAWRDSDGKLAVFRDKCPHRGIQFSLGKIRDNHLQCPFHGFEFDTTGSCVLIPANGKSSQPPAYIRANAYPLREANGFVYVWYTPDPSAGPAIPAENLPEVPWFDNLDDSLVSSGFTDLWKAHYSRAIENQLDVVHVPFIHKTTIGRGIGPIVNGPYIKETANSISFWPFNEQDKGQKEDQYRHVADRVPEMAGNIPNGENESVFRDKGEQPEKTDPDDGILSDRKTEKRYDRGKRVFAVEDRKERGK